MVLQQTSETVLRCLVQTAFPLWLLIPQGCGPAVHAATFAAAWMCQTTFIALVLVLLCKIEQSWGHVLGKCKLPGGLRHCVRGGSESTQPAQVVWGMSNWLHRSILSVQDTSTWPGTAWRDWGCCDVLLISMTAGAMSVSSRGHVAWHESLGAVLKGTTPCNCNPSEQKILWKQMHRGTI